MKNLFIEKIGRKKNSKIFTLKINWIEWGKTLKKNSQLYKE